MSGGGEIPKLSLSVRSPVTTEWPLFSFITHLRPPAPEARWLAHKLLAWVTYPGWFLNSLALLVRSAPRLVVAEKRKQAFISVSGVKN